MAMNEEQRERYLAVVVLIGSILSIVGALYMILGFILIKSLRTFRHQLILGLAVSDLILALNFFIPTLSSILDKKASTPSNPIFCSINGFVTQLFFAQIDVWQLVIAITTLLLVLDKALVLKWAREHIYIIWLFPWIISLATAFFGYGIWDYASLGSFCWLSPTPIRLYFNYLPRWLIIITCLFIYTQIFLLIRRARRRAQIREEFRNAAAARHAHLHLNSPESCTTLAISTHHGQGCKDSSLTVNVGSTPHIAGEQQQQQTPVSVIVTTTPAVAVDEKRLEAEERQKQVRKIAIQLISYPLAYTVLWSIPTVIMIYEVVKARGGEGEGAAGKMSVHVEGMAKLLLVFNGFVDAHVYGFNERTAMGWRKKIRRDEEAATVAAEDREDSESVVHEVVSVTPPEQATLRWAERA